MEYKQSRGDPRLPKTQKEEQNVKQPVIQKKARTEEVKYKELKKLENAG